MSEQLAARPIDPPTVPSLPVVGMVPPARSAGPTEPPPPTPERTRKGRRLDGLDVLRALASCLVFYTHVSTWYRYKQDPMPVSGVIDDYVIGPLHLNKELGFFGVALFFLISGFVMAHVATKERDAEFWIKRALRIFPALVVAALIAWILVNAGLYTIPGDVKSVGIVDLLSNMFLLNFFIDGNATLLGVAWTLITQLGIYAMIGGLLFAFRRAPWLAIAVQITVCSVILSIVPNFDGLTPASIGNIGAFGTAIVLGQVIWLVWTKKAPVWAGFLLGLACWLVFNWGDSIGYGRYDDAFVLTLTLAALLVILAVVASHRVPRLRVVTYLSSRSYAVYLVHQTIAFTVLAQLWPDVPSSVAVAAAITVTLVVAELVHRAVERPFAKLATSLTRRVGR
jgi:exopolysaccharide production protein ExoZ